jgi:formylglycine-generating enzyme
MSLILNMARMKNSIFITVFMLSVSFANAQKPPKPEMILVEGGTFIMGSNGGEIWEKPAHTVTLSTYKISKYEVTKAQYKAFCTAIGREMPDYPDYPGWKDKHPIGYVTFEDANAYCNWLSEKEGAKYRLPTEAECEYAARGGNKSKGYKYSGSNDPDEVEIGPDAEALKVGLKRPNELGLYDMSGNVAEWCMDLVWRLFQCSTNKPERPLCW